MENAVNLRTEPDLMHTINALTQSNRQHIQRVDELRQEIDNFRQRNDEHVLQNMELVQKNAELGQKQAELKQKHATLKQKHDQLRQEHANLKLKLEHTRAGLGKQNTNLTKDNDACKSDIERLKKKNTALINTIIHTGHRVGRWQLVFLLVVTGFFSGHAWFYLFPAENSTTLKLQHQGSVSKLERENAVHDWKHQSEMTNLNCEKEVIICKNNAEVARLNCEKIIEKTKLDCALESKVCENTVYRSQDQLHYVKQESILSMWVVSLSCALCVLFLIVVMCVCNCYRPRSSKQTAKYKHLMIEN